MKESISGSQDAPRRGFGAANLRYRTEQTFAALKHRNYRLWFYGQMVSLFGTWMQSTAQGFLIYQLTGSAAYLGVVGFAAGAPSWLFTLYGGLIADRFSRRSMLMITQTAMMLLAFILAGLTAARLVQPWHIIVLAFMLGVTNAFDAPARMAFVPELIDDREDLTNAIALNATMFNVATAVGPAVSGITYAALGPAWCFLINGLSFIAVLFALLQMRIKALVMVAQGKSALRDIQEGLRYVARQETIRVLILNLGFASLFAFGFITLMPAWAVGVLGGNAATNGYLQSARGIGALVSALMIASMGRFQKKGWLMTLGTFALPITLLVFSAVRWLPLSLLVLAGFGFSLVAQMNMSNALVQGLVPDELRGRVMSIYTLTFFGLLPLGSLMNGSLAELIGEPSVVLLNSILLLVVAALIFWRAPTLRKLP